MNEISATALTTLACHMIDARGKNPILNDRRAVDIYEFIQSNQQPVNKYIRLRKSLVTHICLRARKYDELTRAFAYEHSQAIIINIGCGFDNRFERIDNGRLIFYDLDLPDVISIKRNIFPETERYRHISGSAFDDGWTAAIPKGPILLLAEGVFMYFTKSEVQALFARLKQNFAPCEIFFEVFNAHWLSGWRKKVVEQKLRKQLHFSRDAVFHFGIRDSDEIASWDPAYSLLGEWSYLDTNHRSLGLLRYFRHMKLLRKMQWSVHYKIENSK